MTRAGTEGLEGAVTTQEGDEPSCGGEGHAHAPAVGVSVSAQVLEQAAQMFSALGDAARLQVLERLQHGAWCVTDLADVFGEKLSTMSQRLKILYAARLVKKRRDGKHIFYELADAHVAALLHNVLAHAGEGDSHAHTQARTHTKEHLR